MATLPAIDGMPRPALADLLDGLGVGAVHADTVFSAMHREHVATDRIAALGPRKAALLAQATCRSAVSIEQRAASDDDTTKLVFRMPDGARTEGVLIPHGIDRLTFCVSSQVGCAMGCGFCATAQMGLQRGLTAGEIVAQVRLARQCAPSRVTNLVFMGMGEPLHHYEATTDAIRILTDHRGQMHPMRRITVSTVGLAPKIRRLADDFGGRIQLAVSLNAGTEATRRAIMPIADSFSMATLKDACLGYPLPASRRFILVEYVLLAGLNDTPSELAGLVEWTRGLPCLVNLIAWNAFDGVDFQSPSAHEVERVRATLDAAGVCVTVRRPRGRRVDGACGQLALRSAA